MNDNVSPRAHADLALAVYLEPHAEDRRVLLLGDAEGALADRFDRLAAQLEIIDPGAREPSRGEVPELPFDDQTFDLVLVCDAAALPEPTVNALRELRRVLSRTGLLAVVEPLAPKRRRRPGTPAASLEKLLAAEFRNVRVLAQAPVALYALGELERQPGEEFSVDSSLVRNVEREPERLLGLASEGRLAGEPRLWVEVPLAPAAEERVGAQPGLIEELRRAEDEARDALHRESDLLRELESERRARSEAEHVAERARLFERKLLAAEADYDDAVARVRYFESAIAEREAAAGHDRERREAAERELGHAKADLASAAERLQGVEAERDVAQREFELARSELQDFEQRLTELGQQLLALEQDKKHHQEVARDLLEELRRVEQDKSAAVEHDARVAELEAERERAVQRALEAEVAREAAQMRLDELRAELTDKVRATSAEQPAAARSARESAPRERARAHEAAADERSAERDVPGEPTAKLASEQREELAPLLEQQRARVAVLETQVGRLRGECHGLRLRLNEAELALEAVASPGEQLRLASGELAELRLRLAHSEAALHALREAPRSSAQPEAESASSLHEERARTLEEQLASADQRLLELTRELEEADRFAELHAEDAERLSSVESELENTRERLEDLEQELRTLDDELRTSRVEQGAVQQELERARGDAQRAAADSASRLELAERREAERDDARAALAEARAILSQLAGRVGADENDPPSIFQALLARDDSRSNESERLVDELREELARREQRIDQLERRLAEQRPSDELLAPTTGSTEY